MSEAGDQAFDDLNQLTSELGKLDDRGLVLTLAAFADVSLERLLTAFLRDNAARKKLLDGFNAPLGTFSARISAACALGLVTIEQYEDLERIRKIRNEFSHSWKPISLDNPPVSAHIRSLNYSALDDEFPRTRAEKLRSAGATLLTEIEVIASQIRKRRAGAKEFGFRLLNGLAGTFDEQLMEAASKIDEVKASFERETGEKKAFLRLVLQRWTDRLILVRDHGPADRRSEVDDVRGELLAWIENRSA